MTDFTEIEAADTFRGRFAFHALDEKIDTTSMCVDLVETKACRKAGGS